MTRGGGITEGRGPYRQPEDLPDNYFDLTRGDYTPSTRGGKAMKVAQALLEIISYFGEPHDPVAPPPTMEFPGGESTAIYRDL